MTWPLSHSQISLITRPNYRKKHYSILTVYHLCVWCCVQGEGSNTTCIIIACTIHSDTRTHARNFVVGPSHAQLSSLYLLYPWHHSSDALDQALPLSFSGWVKGQTRNYWWKEETSHKEFYSFDKYKCLLRIFWLHSEKCIVFKLTTTSFIRSHRALSLHQVSWSSLYHGLWHTLLEFNWPFRLTSSSCVQFLHQSFLLGICTHWNH